MINIKKKDRYKYICPVCGNELNIGHKIFHIVCPYCNENFTRKELIKHHNE